MLNISSFGCFFDFSNNLYITVHQGHDLWPLMMHNILPEPKIQLGYKEKRKIKISVAFCVVSGLLLHEMVSTERIISFSYSFY